MTDEQYDDFDDMILDAMTSDDEDPDISSDVLGGAPVDWRTLDDEDARVVWVELRDWVQWFTVRYDIGETNIPDCWWRHGGLVEELSALHLAHKVSFDSTDTGLGPITWHERMTATRDRFKRYYNGQCMGAHQDQRPRNWAHAIGDDEWDSYTSQTHGHRN